MLIRSFYRLYMPKFRRESKLQLWRSDRPRRIATNYGEKWDFFETCWMALLLPVGLVRAYDPGNRFVTSNSSLLSFYFFIISTGDAI